MASRKSRPVLYEVASRATRNLAGGSATVTQGASTSPTVTAGSHGILSDADRAQALEYRDGRIYLSLGWPELLIGVVILAVLLVIAYQMGTRHSNEPPQARTPGIPANPDGPSNANASANHATDRPKSDADEMKSSARRIEPLRTTPRGEVATPAKPEDRVKEVEKDAPRETLKPDNSASPPPPAPEVKSAPPAVEESFKPQKGKWYVAVQYFPSNRRGEAEKAAEYLRENSIQCVVLQSGRDHKVVATEAFDDPRRSKDAQRQIDQFKKRITELGRAYNLKSGYSFSKCVEQALD